MKIAIKAQSLRVPLRSRLKQASFDRYLSDSIWVEALRGDNTGLGEGCPRPYVTGERTESSLEWIESRKSFFESELTSLPALRQYVATSSPEIDHYPGAWCAVETALLDLLSREAGCAIESFLGLPDTPAAFTYTAVVSDEQGDALAGILRKYLAVGFTDFKFKLSGDSDADLPKLEIFADLVRERNAEGFRVRLDANNVWGTEIDLALKHLGRLRGKFDAVEEPLTPNMARDLSRLGTELDVAVILDECLCRVEDLALYDALPARWIANVKVSKTGGILRAANLIGEIRARGWPIVIGAQAGETSVLTRLGIAAARAAGSSLRAVEGAFGTILLEYDPSTPVLQFGVGGRLDLSGTGLGRTGLGLTRNPDISI